MCGLWFPNAFGLAGQHGMSGADGVLLFAQEFEVGAVGGEVFVQHPAGALEQRLFGNDGGRHGRVAFGEAGGEEEHQKGDEHFHICLFF